MFTYLKYLSSVECDGPLAGELEKHHHDEDDEEGLEHRALEQLGEPELFLHHLLVQLGVEVVHRCHFVSVKRQHSLIKIYYVKE